MSEKELLGQKRGRALFEEEKRLFTYQGEDRMVSSHELAEELAKTEDSAFIVPTGVPTLDKLHEGGIEAGEVWVFTGPSGEGKEVSVDTKVLTPTGWKRNGDLVVGEYVIGKNGKKTKVTGVFDQGVKTEYVITFNDDTKVIAGEEHLWQVQSRKQRRTTGNYQILNTKQMLDRGVLEKGAKNSTAYNWFLPLVEPIKFEKQHLPIRPYLLGVLLANGSLTSSVVNFSTNDQQIADNVIAEDKNLAIKERTYRNTTARRWCLFNYHPVLKTLKIDYLKSRDKYIPEQYLFSSVEDRKKLLAGLMDCDGGVYDGRRARYFTFSEALAQDVAALVRSLGGVAQVKKKNRADGDPEHVVVIWTPFNPFSLKRKADCYKPKSWFKAVKSIKIGGQSEMRCISVDAPDSLYVIEDYIVTHNTSITMSITQNMAAIGVKTAWFTLEVTPRQFIQKMKARTENVPLFYLPNENKDPVVGWIEERILEAKVKYNARVVFIDHLQQIFSIARMEKPNSNLSWEIGDLMAKIKQIAVLHSIAICLIVHTKDDPTGSSREPRKEDIRDSGLVQRLADSIVMIWRVPNADDLDATRRKVIKEDDAKAKVRLVKNRRTGKLGTWFMYHTNHYLEEVSSTYGQGVDNF